jgi:uncharacterized protein YciI
VLYAINCRYKPGIEDQHAALSTAFGDHMRQPLLHIRLAGVMRDAGGDRTGFLALMEADDVAVVEAFIRSSPYTEAGLYESVRIDLLDLEIGRLS